MRKTKKDFMQGAKTLIVTCGQVKPKDKVLIIVDDSTKDIGKYLSESAKEITDKTKIIINEQGNMHGTEPSEEIAKAMLEADVIFGVTKFSLAHTNARMNATIKGSKYLSLPDYNLEQLISPALMVDFLEWSQIANKIKKLLDAGEKVNITTQKGTNVILDISDRVSNCCPGFCDKPGMLGSPPDIETNIAPIEYKSEGIFFVDGSIPCKEIGLIEEDIKILLEKGAIKEIDTSIEKGRILRDLLDAKQNPKVKILAEFGIGLNPKAKLCGRMLEDEGCLGTVHFGFGSNATIGGKNNVNFHIDFVIRNPTVTIDYLEIMKEGNLRIKND